MRINSFTYGITLSFLIVWASESARGMIVTSLGMYVDSLHGSKAFLGWTVAVFSIGRFISSFLLGWWAERRPLREVLGFSLLLSVVGNLLYCLAQWPKSKELLLVGRLLVGLGTGNFSVVRAYIAALTSAEDRTRYMGWSGAVQFVGFALMPLMSSLLYLAKFSVGPLEFNAFTLPGYLLVVVNLLLLPAVLWLERRELRSSGKSRSCSPADAGKSDAYHSLWLLLLCTYVGLNFVGRGVLALAEVLGPVDFLMLWEDANYTQADAGLFFAALGAVGLVFYLGADFITKHIISEEKFLVIGFASMILGLVTLLFQEVHFLVFALGSFWLWSVGSPVTQTLTLSLFSKALGDRPQGVWMACIASAGSVGRILFPILTGILPEPLVFIAGAIACLLSMMVYVPVYYSWKNGSVEYVVLPQKDTEDPE